MKIAPDFMLTSIKRYVSDVRESLSMAKSWYSYAMGSYRGVNYMTCLQVTQSFLPPQRACAAMAHTITAKVCGSSNLSPLSETAQRGAPNTGTVAFVHKEDHYRQPQPVSVD